MCNYKFRGVGYESRYLEGVGGIVIYIPFVTDRDIIILLT